MIPDSIDPVVGWRAWLLLAPGTTETGGESGWLLHSVFGGGVWPPRRRMSAACALCPCVPTLQCSCGLYAFRSMEDLPLSCDRVCVLGSVSGWGRVIEHRRGWRSTFAYPITLALSCGLCLRDRGCVSPADRVFVADRGGRRATALCRVHAALASPRPSSRSLRAEAVESELLDLYGVARSGLL